MGYIKVGADSVEATLQPLSSMSSIFGVQLPMVAAAVAPPLTSSEFLDHIVSDGSILARTSRCEAKEVSVRNWVSSCMTPREIAVHVSVKSVLYAVSINAMHGLSSVAVGVDAIYAEEVARVVRRRIKGGALRELSQDRYINPEDQNASRRVTLCIHF